MCKTSLPKLKVESLVLVPHSAPIAMQKIPMTILQHTKLAEAQRMKTPFKSVASFSCPLVLNILS